MIGIHQSLADLIFPYSFSLFISCALYFYELTVPVLACAHVRDGDDRLLKLACPHVRGLVGGHRGGRVGRTRRRRGRARIDRRLNVDVQPQDARPLEGRATKGALGLHALQAAAAQA